MKRVILLTIATLFAVCAFAQTQEVSTSIVIYPESFRDINQDSLTGVDIDPIAKDPSRNACARVKIKFDRMTREQVDELEIMFRSNTYLAKQKVADYFDNVLILEMTAKKGTRFYVKSPSFGESNEVTIDLVGDHTYEMEASLNEQFTISILSNVENADVYLNDEFKGKTNSDKICTVSGMFQGEYTLRLEYGNYKQEKPIHITADSSYFKIDVNLKSNVYQYLTINTHPATAMVEIDGEPVARTDGKIRKKLVEGPHHYKVSASNYYTKEGTIVLDGASAQTIDVKLDPAFGYLKIVGDSQALTGAEIYVNNSRRGTYPLKQDIAAGKGKHEIQVVKNMYHKYTAIVEVRDNQVTEHNVVLIPNFSEVSITAQDNAEIWIDGEKVGTGSWQGRLAVGNYNIECRKESHQPVMHLLKIESTDSTSYTFGALIPIYGSLDIDCNVDGADVYVDGKKVGVTPNVFQNILVGQRKVEVRKSGYKSVLQTVTVNENQSSSYSPKLVAGISTPVQSASASTSSKSTSKTTTKSVGTNAVNNMLQLAVGLEYGFGDGHSAIAVPIAMRVGRVDQFLNGFIGVRANFKMNDLSDSSISVRSELLAIQGSPFAKIRANIVRNRSSLSSVYLDLGAMYNFNSKVRYKTGYISSNSISGLKSDTYYWVGDLHKKTSVSAMAAIGWSCRLFDASLYCTYDITKSYDTTNVPYHIVDEYYSTAPITLEDYRECKEFFTSRFNIGLSVNIYFGSGALK